ncbi:MAG: phenylacetate-CoA oxygenase/reductase subunit PaaK [Deltaproteobacteria bacterium]|nr:phenylacetate-CoA oxygenase/reductase subunit PaaK [Deltaproteobacteria bacterium]
MSKFHEVKIASVRPETRDAIAVTFEVPAALADQFSYTQGQHLTLHTQVNGEDIRRSYSICAAVQDKRLRIAIKRVPGGLFSNWANDFLKPGRSVELMPPSGHFNVALSPQNRKHYVAFAAGSGITPVFSIVKTTLLTEPHSQVTLVYGNRSSSSVIFKEELADLKDLYRERLNLVFILSREQQDIDLFNGRIDRAKCDALLEKWIDPASLDIAFLCGPLGMMEDVSASLQAHGLSQAQIKMELFATSLSQGPRPMPVHHILGHNECQVTVIQDGRTRQFTMEKNTESVLESGLAQGIELPYSCKGGICSTCRGKVIKGEVDMDANFALEDYEIARGFRLLCQSYPVTDQLVIDFDQET